MSERFCKYLKRGYCSVKAKIVNSRECERCKSNSTKKENRENGNQNQ